MISAEMKAELKSFENWFNQLLNIVGTLANGAGYVFALTMLLFVASCVFVILSYSGVIPSLEEIQGIVRMMLEYCAGVSVLVVGVGYLPRRLRNVFVEAIEAKYDQNGAHAKPA